MKLLGHHSIHKMFLRVCKGELFICLIILMTECDMIGQYVGGGTEQYILPAGQQQVISLNLLLCWDNILIP